MKVVEQFQDFLDEDGFSNVFILDTGYVVITTEKRGFLLDQNGEICDTIYKCGWDDGNLNQALEKIDVPVRDFISPIRWLYDNTTK